MEVWRTDAAQEVFIVLPLTISMYRNFIFLLGVAGLADYVCVAPFLECPYDKQT